MDKIFEKITICSCVFCVRLCLIFVFLALRKNHKRKGGNYLLLSFIVMYYIYIHYNGNNVSRGMMKRDMDSDSSITALHCLGRSLKRVHWPVLYYVFGKSENKLCIREQVLLWE